jgi:hypothetical protein
VLAEKVVDVPFTPLAFLFPESSIDDAGRNGSVNLCLMPNAIPVVIPATFVPINTVKALVPCGCELVSVICMVVNFQQGHMIDTGRFNLSVC